MVHGSLSSHPRADQARTHVPLTVENLLERGEFRHTSATGLGLTLRAGDRLMIREIGHFAIRVYLPRRKGRALVWVGLRGDKNIVWKAPVPHPDNYLAALDAYKLTTCVTFSRVGGD